MSIMPSKPKDSVLRVNYDNVRSQRDFVRNLNIDYAQRLAKVADRVFAEAYVRICLPNDLAIFCLTDAVSKLRQGGYLTRNVKHHAMRAQEAVRKYEKALAATLSRRQVFQYFMDFSDAYQERMQKHVFLLRMALKSFLDRHGEKDSETKSYAVLANVMFGAAVMQFDAFWNTHTAQGVDLRADFAIARLQGAFSAWRTAVESIPFSTRDDPQLDKNVTLGVEVLLRQMNNSTTINLCGTQALEMNPDRIKALAERIEKNQNREQ